MMADTSRILASLRSHKLVDGLTHNFYSYPARFSPELAREIIRHFSGPGDWILDPFMGSGTAVVEALAAGRNAIGVDINSLAWFVALAKTTPMLPSEINELRKWASNLPPTGTEDSPSLQVAELSKHFPKRFLRLLDALLASADGLSTESSKRLARLAMLKVYQNSLTSRTGYPRAELLRARICHELEKLLMGLEMFLSACQEVGFSRQRILAARKLLHRSSRGIEHESSIKQLIGLPRLVFTSPPYPGVHVLYNKWQIASRKETGLPYYISGMNDAKPESYYTFGGRSKAGLVRYFDLVTDSFRSLSKLVHPEALIAQLIGFSDSRAQLNSYLGAMQTAGYKEIFPLSTKGQRLWRDVPNRKWYTRIGDRWDSSREVLLFHVLDQQL